MLVLADQLSHYKIELFNSINRIDDSFYVLTYREPPQFRISLNKEFPHICFSYRECKSFVFFGINLSIGLLSSVLKDNNKCIILGGYSNILTLPIILLCKLQRKKIILRTGSHVFSITNRSFFANLYRKLVYNLSDSVLCYGTMSYEYAKLQGLPNTKITIESNSVDTDKLISYFNFFSSSALPNKNITVLFVGQLIERKNIFTLLYAAHFLLKNYSYIKFKIIGTGPLESALKSFVFKNNISNVSFLGAKNQTQLFDEYINSDILCLPSINEVWGLVVNEAMCFKNAIIVSSKCGCASDLIDANGVSLNDPTDYTELVNAILFVSDPENLFSMKEKSLQIISSFNLKHTTDMYIDSISKAFL